MTSRTNKKRQLELKKTRGRGSTSEFKSLSPFSNEEELDFWGNQIAEHMQFIYSGLVESDLIEQNNLEKYLDDNIFGLRDESLDYYQRWIDILESIKIGYDENENALFLIDETLNYQNKILGALDQSIFIGYLYPSLIEHMNEETTYLQNKLMGQGYNLEQEIAFWIDHHKGETAVAEKQLDPKEKRISDAIRTYDEYLEKLGEDPSQIRDYKDMEYVLQEYDKLGKSLLNKNIKGKVLSITPITLIEHAIREGKRAQQIFKWFNSQT